MSNVYTPFKWKAAIFASFITSILIKPEAVGWCFVALGCVLVVMAPVKEKK